ncbi:MAG: hypothetical protein EOO40_07250, partial [Deltaproteobacteria bacterium]
MMDDVRTKIESPGSMLRLGVKLAVGLLALSHPAAAVVSRRGLWYRHVPASLRPAWLQPLPQPAAGRGATFLPMAPDASPRQPPSLPQGPLHCNASRTAHGCPEPFEPEGGLGGYLGLCLMTRDEPYDIPQWLDHYRALGVSAFYIYDHNSTLPLREGLAETLAAGDTSYRYFNEYDGHDSKQMVVYNSCLEEHRSSHRFMGFLDVDEYIIPIRGPAHLPTFLQQFEGFGALGINWRQFGSSGHVQRPGGKVIDNYIDCYPRHDENNKHVKLLGNTAYIERLVGPHEATYLHGKFAVTENGEPFAGPLTHEVSMTNYVIHHYVL